MNVLQKAVLAIVVSLTVMGCDQRNGPVEQKITCVNNLKQIGLGLRTSALDYSGHFPFEVSTNHGGTFELCARDRDGFDENAALHYRAMSNELSTPMILVCPEDKVRRAATNWVELSAVNVTYRLRSSVTNGAGPNAIVVVCPVDGNVLYSDGHVAERAWKGVQ